MHSKGAVLGEHKKERTKEQGNLSEHQSKQASGCYTRTSTTWPPLVRAVGAAVAAIRAIGMAQRSESGTNRAAIRRRGKSGLARPQHANAFTVAPRSMFVYSAPNGTQPR